MASSKQSLPSFEDFMLPLLQLAGDGKEHTLAETIESLSKKFGLSTEQRRQLLPSGRQPVVSNRIGWARTYLTKAHLLESTGRALFKITERGKEIIEQSPQRIDVSFLERFKEFVTFRNSGRSSRTVASHTGDAEVSISISSGRATIILDAKRLPEVLSALRL